VKHTWVSVALVAALPLAFWLGTRASRPAAAPPAPAPAAPAARAPAPVAAAGLDRDDVRAVIREELARLDRAPALPEEDPAADDAEVARAHTAALSTVESGIADGVWDDADRQALRAQLGALGEAETHDVLSPLFQAINDQRLALDGPPI
jgi:hypothetical protein